MDWKYIFATVIAGVAVAAICWFAKSILKGLCFVIKGIGKMISSLNRWRKKRAIHRTVESDGKTYVNFVKAPLSWRLGIQLPRSLRFRINRWLGKIK